MSKLNYLAKVLAALILHSYQNYALWFTFRFPLFHSRPMEGSEEHDVLFLREMLARNVFATKKGSPARRLVWEAVVHSLDEIHSPKFQLKDKKAVLTSGGSFQATETILATATTIWKLGFICLHCYYLNQGKGRVNEKEIRETS